MNALMNLKFVFGDDWCRGYYSFLQLLTVWKEIWGEQRYTIE